MAAISFSERRQALRQGQARTAGHPRHQRGDRGRRIRRDRRPVRLRQVHAAAHGGGAGGDQRRRDRHRRAVVNELEPAERDIAMVFQNYALYPHMSVFDNMAYGLKIRKLPRDEIKARVDKAATILELGPLLLASRASCRAGSGSASPWAARSCASRRSSCSTSPCPTWTPSCGRRPGWRSRSCTANWASLRCSSRTTRWRR